MTEPFRSTTKITLFDQSGYLSNEMVGIEKRIYEKNQALFDLCYEFNVLLHKFKYQMNANSNDGQALLVVCAFIKELNSFQSLIVLAQKGLVIEAQVMLRVILETLIILKLLVEDEQFYREYILTDQIYRKRLLEAAVRNRHSLFDATRELAASGTLERLNLEINELSIKKDTTEKLAERAGLSYCYDSVYRIESGSLHASPRALEQYVRVDNRGDIESFNPGPFEVMDVELTTALAFMLNAAELALKFFKIEEPSEFREIKNRILKLGKD